MARKHPSSKDIQRGSTAVAPRQEDSLQSLARRLDRFFEAPWEVLGASFQAFEPRVELEQKPAELVVSARLPGYKREDIAVDLTEDSLTLRGCRSSAKESQSFVRSMTLPAAVKASQAKASLKGGKLEIRLPRTKPADVKRLQVEE